jgi:hypothetical protein
MGVGAGTTIAWEIVVYALTTAKVSKWGINAVLTPLIELSKSIQGP